MKRLSDCVSPMSWFFILLATFPPFLLLFRPSLKEFIVAFVVDTLCYFINKPVEGRIFKTLYPDTTYYFDGIEGVSPNLSTADKINLLKSLVEFPRRRAAFSYFGSFLKVLPTLGIIVFYWQHQISNGMQFALAMGTFLITSTYFYGSVFLESHVFCSKLVAQLHTRFDFTETFKTLEIVYKKGEFEFHELITLSFIIIFMFILQGLIVISGDYSTQSFLVFKLAMVGLVSLLLFARIWYLGRRYFFGALEALFQQLKFLDYRQARLILPLHTSPLVGRFEQSFNFLVERLIKSEQDLSAIICQEAEKGRYQALGEISGLVAHDLSGPLHAAQFWMSEIDANGMAPEEFRRIERVRVNLGQAEELILSLRARLKNSDNSPQTVMLKDAHNHVVRLLETQFGDYALGKIEIHLDTNIENVILAIPRVHLIQILDNLYRNSLKDLITNQIVPASIHVSRGNANIGQVCILIADNGSGLTAEKFKSMTAYQFMISGSEPQTGLGLRLIKRLVEYHQGMLEIVESDMQGTVFQLSLHLAGDTVKGVPVGTSLPLEVPNYASI